MTLIDKTYFNIDINLTSEQLKVIQDWIDEYEPILLKSLLGYDHRRNNGPRNKTNPII